MSETEHGIYFVEEIAKGTEYSYNGWKVICK